MLVVALFQSYLYYRLKAYQHQDSATHYEHYVALEN